MYNLVFDMDETLGFFSQISRLWFPLMELNNNNLTNRDFYDLCDKFPKILRPNIISILLYCKKLKSQNKINKVILYTDNFGPVSWTYLIADYLNYKAKDTVFDVVIPAYKKDSANCRTVDVKTYNDLIKCSNLSPNSKICFFDDQPHSKMNNHKNVTSVFVNSYNFFYTTREISTHLKHLNFFKKIYENAIQSSLEEHLLEYNSKPRENTNIKLFIDRFIKTKSIKTKSIKTKSIKTKSKSIKTKSKTRKTISKHRKSRTKR